MIACAATSMDMQQETQAQHSLGAVPAALQMKTEPMRPWSWILIAFITLLAVFSAWVGRNPYDVGGTLGYAVGTLLVVFVVAYLIRGRQRDWNSFARWYFCLGLILLISEWVVRLLSIRSRKT